MKEILHKTPKMYEIEGRFGVAIEELLRSLYIDEGMSLVNLADHIGIHKSLLVKWLVLAGIYSKRLKI